MFSNIKNPGTIVMAGNPVIFSGTSDITANSFPTILATFQCYRGESPFYKEEYTYPLGTDGNFQFDLSDALTEAFRQLDILTTVPTTVPSGSTTVPSGSAAGSTAGSTPPIHTPEVLTYTLTISEQYFHDGNLYPGDTVIIGTPVTTPSNPSTPLTEGSNGSTTMYAIPGFLTDFERSRMENDNIATLLSPARALSRKPAEGDITVKGTYFIYPYITITDGIPSLAYARSLRQAIGKQTQPALSQGINRATYVTENDGTLFPIIFWNRFGLMESVTAKALPTIQHQLQSTQYAVQREHTFRSIAEQRSHTEHAPMQIKLTSGVVNRQWYEWWIAEVLTTPQLYVMLNGTWHSATIIPDNTIKFDLSKPEALSVEFAIKLSTSGCIYNSIV